MEKRKCRACEYTSEIHKAAAEAEIERLKNMKGIKICSPEEQEKRLKICDECEYLDMNGVCLMCGCYVQIRTLLKSGSCPAKKKRWSAQ